MLSIRKFLVAMGVALALIGGTSAAEPDRFLSSETEQVVVINIKQMMTSPIVKKNLLPIIKEALKDNKEYKQIQEATGLDVLEDVHSIVIGNAGTTGDKVSFIIRGKFDVEKINKVAEAVAKEKGELKISKLGDRNLFEGKNKDGKEMFATFIDGTTIVGSTSKDLVKAAVDGKGGKLNKDIAAAMENLDGKQSAWMVALVPEEAKQAIGGLQQGPVEALKKVKAISGALNVTTDVMATLSLSTADPKAAKELGDFANQAKGLLAFFAQQNEQIKPFAEELLKTLQIKTNKGDVSVSFKLSEELIKKAIEEAMKNR